MQEVEVAEKRAIRRFTLQLPVTITGSSGEKLQTMAKTRDVSSHGICFYCDTPMSRGAEIEFTLTLPADITMTEDINVRCRARVIRVDSASSAGKYAVAAQIESYEFLA